MDLKMHLNNAFQTPANVCPDEIGDNLVESIGHELFDAESHNET